MKHNKIKPSLSLWIYASIAFFIAGCSARIEQEELNGWVTPTTTQEVLPTDPIAVVKKETPFATALTDWSHPLYPSFASDTEQAVWQLPRLILRENGNIYRPDGRTITLKFVFEFPDRTLSELLENFPLQEPDMDAYYPAGENVQFRFLRNIRVYTLDGKPYDIGFIGGSRGTLDVNLNGVVYAGEGIHLMLLREDLRFENNKTEILVDITFASGFDYPSPVRMIIPVEYFEKTPANGP